MEVTVDATIQLLEAIRAVARHPRGGEQRQALSEYLRGIPITERAAPVGAIELNAARASLAPVAQRDKHDIAEDITDLGNVFRVGRLPHAVALHCPARVTAWHNAVSKWYAAQALAASLAHMRRMASAAATMRKQDRLSYSDWFQGGRLTGQSFGPPKARWGLTYGPDKRYPTPSKSEVLLALARSGVTPEALARAGHPFAKLTGGSVSIAAPKRRHRRGKRGGRKHRDA